MQIFSESVFRNPHSSFFNTKHKFGTLFRKEFLEILIFQYKTKELTSKTSFFNIIHKDGIYFRKEFFRDPHFAI